MLCVPFSDVQNRVSLDRYRRQKAEEGHNSCRSRQDGGRKEDQEGAGEYQQQTGFGREVWEIYSRLRHHPEVAEGREGQTCHYRQQLSAAQEIRDRVLCHAFQDWCASLQREQRGSRDGLWEVLPCLLLEYY